MKDGKASYSAEIIAAMRALESRKPEHLRICYDPYARHLIRSRFRKVAQTKLITKLIYWFVERKGPGLPAGIAARTRYIDDIVKQEVANGTKQVVIMGAGLDMRAFRLKELKDIPVFEVDFPATQQLKQRKLESIELPERNQLHYVPIDFMKDELSEVLAKSGYDHSIKTLFIWEGVTMYLNAESVDSTLAFVASNTGTGTTVYFDYLMQSVLDGRCNYPEAVAVRNTASFNSDGVEKYSYGIEDSSVEQFLSQRKFKLLEHMTGESLKERYFHGENAKRYVFRICGFVHAQIQSQV
ncbi:MAG: class I SAM-dependent methyltransferase [Flavobacteriales bacterium]|nr:class I SAM-dependent methyltransferase [Flavobacteriales bacterium]